MSEDEKKISEKLVEMVFLAAMAQALEKFLEPSVETISQGDMEVAELERMFRL